MSDTTSAVYTTAQMLELLQCSINEIPRLIEAGAIPAPLPSLSPRGKRRWARAVVNRKLGLPVEAPVADVQAVVRAEVKKALRGLEVSPRGA